MKRKDLVKLLERNGWWLLREGGDHALYTNGQATESVPRHAEINEYLARDLIKRRGLIK